MSACRRAAEQLENLSADVSGSGLYNPRSEPGDWELNCPLRSTEEDWSGSVEPFPANMDDLGKFAGAQRTADAAQECLLEHNGGCRSPVIFAPQPTCSLVGSWGGFVSTHGCPVLDHRVPVMEAKFSRFGQAESGAGFTCSGKAPACWKLKEASRLKRVQAAAFSAEKTRLCGDLVSRFVPRLGSARLGSRSDTSSLFHITQTGHAALP